MSEMDRATLRQTIRDRGDYTNVRRHPPAFLNALIQKAFEQFWTIVADTHQGWWDTEDTIVTVANQKHAALPRDCWRVQGVDVFDAGEWLTLAQISLADRNRFGTSTGRPCAYRTSSRGLELYETPSAVYTLRINYTPKAPQLPESQPRDWFNGWEDYIIEEVLYQLAKREKMPLKDHLDAVANAVAYLKTAVGERRSQEPEYIKLYEDVDALDLYIDGRRKG